MDAQKVVTLTVRELLDLLAVCDPKAKVLFASWGTGSVVSLENHGDAVVLR